MQSFNGYGLKRGTSSWQIIAVAVVSLNLKLAYKNLYNKDRHYSFLYLYKNIFFIIDECRVFVSVWNYIKEYQYSYAENQFNLAER